MKRHIIAFLIYFHFVFPFKYIKKIGKKIVYLYRITLDSFGHIRTRVQKKRYEREYVISSISELKEQMNQIRDELNLLTQEIDNIKKNVDENKYYALLDSLKISTDELEKQIKKNKKEV